jgi:hypothetical protein
MREAAEWRRLQGKLLQYQEQYSKIKFRYNLMLCTVACSDIFWGTNFNLQLYFI